MNEVEKARNQDEWRLEYMTWNLFEQDAREEGMEEGIKKGQKTMAVSSIKSLMQKLGYTVTEAMDVLSIPDDEREQLRAMIK